MKLHGINFNVAWSRFTTNTTFWFPCLDIEEAKKVVRAACDRRGIRIIVRTSVENGILGLRVWRRVKIPPPLDSPSDQT